MQWPYELDHFAIIIGFIRRCRPRLWLLSGLVGSRCQGRQVRCQSLADMLIAAFDMYPPCWLVVLWGAYKAAPSLRCCRTRCGERSIGAPFGPKNCESDGRGVRLGIGTDQKKIFGNDSDAVEAARMRLAEAILSIATKGNTDIVDLKNRAIVKLARTTGRA